jgi:hypothetical protein
MLVETGHGRLRGRVACAPASRHPPHRCETTRFDPKARHQIGQRCWLIMTPNGAFDEDWLEGSSSEFEAVEAVSSIVRTGNK